MLRLRPFAAFCCAALLGVAGGACHILGRHGDYIPGAGGNGIGGAGQGGMAQGGGGQGGMACVLVPPTTCMRASLDCNKVCGDDHAVETCHANSGQCEPTDACMADDLTVTILDTARDPQNPTRLLNLVLDQKGNQWTLSLQAVTWSDKGSCNQSAATAQDVMTFGNGAKPTIEARVGFGFADTYVAWSSDSQADIANVGPAGAAFKCHILSTRTGFTKLLLTSTDCSASGLKGLVVRPGTGMPTNPDRLMTMEVFGGNRNLHEVIDGITLVNQAWPFPGTKFLDSDLFGGVGVVLGTASGPDCTGGNNCLFVAAKNLIGTSGAGDPWTVQEITPTSVDGAWLRSGNTGYYTALDVANNPAAFVLKTNPANPDAPWSFGFSGDLKLGKFEVTADAVDRLYLVGTFSGVVTMALQRDTQIPQGVLESSTGEGAFLVEIDGAGNLVKLTSFPLEGDTAGFNFDFLEVSDETPLVIGGQMPLDGILHLSSTQAVPAGAERQWLSTLTR